MDTTKKPGILSGALVGGLLTAPLMVVLFLGDLIAGLPFVPLDLFDWLVRVLPGGLLTFGIDLMIDVLTVFAPNRVNAVAKTAEQIMGLALFLLIGVVAGALFFVIMRRRTESPGRFYAPGIIAGLIVGLPLIVISFDVNFTATASPIVSLIWLGIVFAAWGAGLNWVYNALLNLESEQDKATDTEVTVLSRRQFLVRLGSAAATFTVIGSGLGAVLNASAERTPVSPSTTDIDLAGDATDDAILELPNADATVQPAPGTRLEYTPVEDHYRTDISSRPPVIDEDWALAITGMVDSPLELTVDDLRNRYEEIEEYITLSCISNRIAGRAIGTTRWTGVSLQQVLEDVQLSPDAGYLKISSADGFYEYVSLELINEDERIMLAYEWDGQPLTPEHGYPLRIYIPDHYGMKQPKWITDIEAVSEWDEGYWVARGWSRTAIVRTTSVIDTVAVDSIYEENGAMLLPIGGIAHAGDRGVSQVEVKIDDGEWQGAQLRTPLSDLTWVVWRYDWEFTAGEHTFAVRCYEGDGTEQISRDEGTRPDGATGIHTMGESVSASK